MLQRQMKLNVYTVLYKSEDRIDQGHERCRTQEVGVEDEFESESGHDEMEMEMEMEIVYIRLDS